MESSEEEEEDVFVFGFRKKRQTDTERFIVIIFVKFPILKSFFVMSYFYPSSKLIYKLGFIVIPFLQYILPLKP